MVGHAHPTFTVGLGQNLENGGCRGWFKSRPYNHSKLFQAGGLMNKISSFEMQSSRLWPQVPASMGDPAGAALLQLTPGMVIIFYN